MGVGAGNWAWAQELPLKPKFVLIKLADQTDDRTGHVCYQQSDLAYLAKKCSMPVRSMSRCIAALIRNGYMGRTSGKDKGMASTYWLLLDREPSEKMSDFQWKIVSDGEAEPQDIDDGSAYLADPPDDSSPVDNVDFGRGGRPIRGPARVSDSTILPSRARASAVPKDFSREAQDLERGIVCLKEVAESQGAKVFVIEGTRAWQAHCEDRRRRGLPGTLPTCTGTGKFAGKRGWYMPSLFPKIDQTTGPPAGLCTDEDERVFAESG